MSVTAPDYTHFPTHAELTELLHRWAGEAPDLAQVERIGESWQGREIWLLTLTNRRTGVAADKPAYLVEATIHAAELTSGFAALHFAHLLVSGFGSDERVTRLLDDAAVYVVPRLCPDGAEVVIEQGCYVRSSVRPYPDAERQPGLHQADVDGDGRVLFMRIPDPDGPWRVSVADPRLLVRRAPDEFGGDYYRLLLEGEVVDHDGLSVPSAPDHLGLDLATNFHAGMGEARSRGASDFTGSEPEIRALVEAVAARPNISAYVSCHTFGAVHLHPPLNDDERVPDAAVFAELGGLAAERTGYRSMSYLDLKHEPYRVSGGQLAWFYYERGVLAWITELWNPLRAAGVTDFHPAGWLVDHDEADDHALLRWSDEQLGGQGFVDWYRFDHPQLGKVELGGWDLVHFWYNPPLSLVEAEVAPHSDWLLTLGLTLPRLRIDRSLVEPLGEDRYRVKVAVRNTGWLPTTGSRLAAERGLCGPVELTVAPDNGVTVLAGGGRTRLGQLSGRSRTRSSTTWWGHEPGTPDLAVHELVVHAPAGGSLIVRASHPRAGVAEATVSVGG